MVLGLGAVISRVSSDFYRNRKSWRIIERLTKLAVGVPNSNDWCFVSLSLQLLLLFFLHLPKPLTEDEALSQFTTFAFLMLSRSLRPRNTNHHPAFPTHQFFIPFISFSRFLDRFKDPSEEESRVREASPSPIIPP